MGQSGPPCTSNQGHAERERESPGDCGGIRSRRRGRALQPDERELNTAGVKVHLAVAPRSAPQPSGPQQTARLGLLRRPAPRSAGCRCLHLEAGGCMRRRLSAARRRAPSVGRPAMLSACSLAADRAVPQHATAQSDGHAGRGAARVVAPALITCSKGARAFYCALSRTVLNSIRFEVVSSKW